MLAAQMAAQNDAALNKSFDYLYVRKSRKSSGTCQQLEGQTIYTSRTPDSPELLAVWLDDALSTGSSLLEGIQMLKSEYNIRVVAAVYLVDRSKDRQTLTEQQQKLASAEFDSVTMHAIYDLEQVDAIIPKK